MIRPCPNCLRNTETDETKPVRYGTVLIPAYLVCCFCGWSYGAKEENA